jgi:hypothetical protein
VTKLSPVVGLLADLPTGVFNEAALAIAHSADPDTARRQIGDALRWLFDSLRTAHHATTQPAAVTN